MVKLVKSLQRKGNLIELDQDDTYIKMVLKYRIAQVYRWGFDTFSNNQQLLEDYHRDEFCSENSFREAVRWFDRKKARLLVVCQLAFDQLPPISYRLSSLAHQSTNRRVSNFSQQFFVIVNASQINFGASTRRKPN